MTAAPQAIAQLPTATASTIKREGWKSVMRALSAEGKLVVTNHNKPEAVVLSTQEYDRLITAARAALASLDDPLQALRDQFDARLAALDEPDAASRLRNLMHHPGQLNGQVKAGDTY